VTRSGFSLHFAGRRWQANTDKLAKKYIGMDKYPYLQPGEKRVVVTIKPDKVDSQGFE
jgi:hypothetical protein